VIVLLVKITELVRILETGLSVLVQNNMKEIVAKQEVCSLWIVIVVFDDDDDDDSGILEKKFWFLTFVV
jgi:hypothetical protein